MYLSLAMCSISFGCVYLYFLVDKEGTYNKIFPVFVFAGSMCFVAANKFSHLLLKSLPKIKINTYLGRLQIVCSNPSLFLQFQCVYFVIMNIPSCFIGNGIDAMLLAFGTVFGLAVLEKGCLNLSVQIQLLETLREAQKSTLNHTSISHASRIRQLRLVVVTCAFLILVAELSCGLVAVWRKIQFPSSLFSLMIGFSCNFTIHVLIIIFPPKNKRSAVNSTRQSWNEYRNSSGRPNKRRIVCIVPRTERVPS